MGNLNLIKVSSIHKNKIFEWRNENTTRIMSKNSSLILWEDHSKWFDNILQDKNVSIFIGEANNNLVGVIRFTKNFELVSEYKVSIIISKEFRNEGYGNFLLKKGIKKIWEEDILCQSIVADIKKINSSSIKLFTKNNFKLINKSEFINTYKLIRE